ncbi:hypothetical protein [Nocardioides malaquae]|nr:hypothetical protein [Nocardioides malaquae]
MGDVRAAARAGRVLAAVGWGVRPSWGACGRLVAGLRGRSPQI